MTVQPAKYGPGQRVNIEVAGIVAEGEIRSASFDADAGIWCYIVALDDGQKTVLYERYLSPAGIRFRQFI